MPTVRHTRADYERLPEGACAQLIEGELVMAPAPTPWHEQLVVRFILRLGVLLGADADRRILGSKFEIAVGSPPDEEIAQPDIAVLPPGTRPHGRSWTPPVPILVAEVLSPSTAKHDRGAKLRIYGTAGVKEAWLLDPADETIEVHDLAYGNKRTFARGETADSHAVPGFRVDVAAFFAA